MTLYLDGQLVGSVLGIASRPRRQLRPDRDRDTRDDWPADTRGWYGFVGQIDDVRIWSVARSAGEISQDMTTAPSGTEPGLEADYPFDEGQGLTAHDQTPNHNDGTLAGSSGDLPHLGQWQRRGHRPRRRWHHLQRQLTSPGTEQPPELPDRRHHRRRPARGLAGRQHARHDLPHRPLRQRRLRPGGAGQAEDYLGSLEVTTDSQGQAVFDVPFTPPAGLPVVTATATDPEGNTSEVSASAGPRPGARADGSHWLPVSR